ncbi:hypothetical protein VTL71DRAFT_7881 [Oculimacula yallundae]|uniref:S-adenosyl-L-methionine-dependent methyltransferase n=1 Tax=Oculimacula yallundae TaxID=86028 RepID=A0ABR4CVY5_9HELO
MTAPVPTPLTGSGPAHSVPEHTPEDPPAEVLAPVADGSQPPQNNEDDFDEPDDNDSAFGDDASSTGSVASTIRHYREEHGRTYHNYGNTEYWGPNDETQNEQLDIGHHMCTLVLENKLYLAPIGENVQKVLDIGTGTGIWAIDFADQHPSASVIGTDISPIQPTWVPPNLKFEIDDAQLEWTYADNDFDYIHIRCLMGSIDNWPLLYSRAFKATKPGGYIEHLDMDIQFTSDDGSVKEGDVMYEWSKLFIKAGDMIGRTFTIARDSTRLLEEAGFVDVIEKKYKIPVGAWMPEKRWKEIGRWDLLYLTAGLEGMALYQLKHVLGWEYAEIQVYLAEMRKALMTKSNHGYYGITVSYGRKPESTAD